MLGMQIFSWPEIFTTECNACTSVFFLHYFETIQKQCDNDCVFGAKAWDVNYSSLYLDYDNDSKTFYFFLF